MTLDHLVGELALAQATQLARAGKYDAARRLLSDLGNPDGAPASHLDLLARINAQQGRLAEADACWARAAELGGDTEAFQAGRRRIAAIQHRALSRWRPLRAAGATALVLAAVALIAGLFLPLRGWILQARDAQRALADRMASLEQRMEQPAPAPTPPAPVLPAIAAAVGAPGVSVRSAPGALVVGFDDGLFERGDALTPEGERALGDLALRLAPYAGNVSIGVVGHTDDVPLAVGARQRDNLELGLARALAAARHMSTVSGIPFTDFALSSTGSGAAPFTNDTPEGRARNRTVTITLTVLAEGSRA